MFHPPTMIQIKMDAVAIPCQGGKPKQLHGVRQPMGARLHPVLAIKGDAFRRGLGARPLINRFTINNDAGFIDPPRCAFKGAIHRHKNQRAGLACFRFDLADGGLPLHPLAGL